MDHDHTLFVSDFYISKDYFLWRSVFIRVESVREKARREESGSWPVDIKVWMFY